MVQRLLSRRFINDPELRSLRSTRRSATVISSAPEAVSACSVSSTLWYLPVPTMSRDWKRCEPIFRPSCSVMEGPLAPPPARGNVKARYTAGAMSGWPKDVLIHSSAWVDPGCTIGSGTRVWHFSHVMASASIGRDCTLGQNVFVAGGAKIGNHVKIQNNVSLYHGVELEDEVFCGPSCVFTNVNNPRAAIERKSEFAPTLVKRGDSIGANATIVCGHTLGEYCFIAAGAVVTRNVPAFALMAGVPARRIGWMSHDGERLGPDLVCPRSGRRYREAGPDRI